MDSGYPLEKVSYMSSFHSSCFIKVKLHVKWSQKCFYLICNGIIQITYISTNSGDCLENITLDWMRLKGKIAEWCGDSNSKCKNQEKRQECTPEREKENTLGLWQCHPQQVRRLLKYIQVSRTLLSNHVQWQKCSALVHQWVLYVHWKKGEMNEIKK